jgi:hypothetical protein
MLFAIFTISVITIELILRHHARQEARQAPDPSMDLLRLAQALGPAPGSTVATEEPARTEKRASQVLRA